MCDAMKIDPVSNAIAPCRNSRLAAVHSADAAAFAALVQLLLAPETFVVAAKRWDARFCRVAGLCYLATPARELMEARPANASED